MDYRFRSKFDARTDAEIQLHLAIIPIKFAASEAEGARAAVREILSIIDRLFANYNARDASSAISFRLSSFTFLSHLIANSGRGKRKEREKERGQFFESSRREVTRVDKFDRHFQIDLHRRSLTLLTI